MLRNQVPLILEATETVYEPLFLFYPGRRLVRTLWLCGGLGQAIVELCLVAIKVTLLKVHHHQTIKRQSQKQQWFYRSFS